MESVAEKVEPARGATDRALHPVPANIERSEDRVGGEDGALARGALRSLADAPGRDSALAIEGGEGPAVRSPV